MTHLEPPLTLLSLLSHTNKQLMMAVFFFLCNLASALSVPLILSFPGLQQSPEGTAHPQSPSSPSAQGGVLGITGTAGNPPGLSRPSAPVCGHQLPQSICWEQGAECPPFPSGSELSATGACAQLRSGDAEFMDTVCMCVWERSRHKHALQEHKSSTDSWGVRGLLRSPGTPTARALCAGPFLCCIIKHSLWKHFNITALFITEHEKQGKPNQKQTLTVHSSLQLPDWAESCVNSGVLRSPIFPHWIPLTQHCNFYIPTFMSVSTQQKVEEIQSLWSHKDLIPSFVAPSPLSAHLLLSCFYSGLQILNHSPGVVCSAWGSG